MNDEQPENVPTPSPLRYRCFNLTGMEAAPFNGAWVKWIDCEAIKKELIAAQAMLREIDEALYGNLQPLGYDPDRALTIRTMIDQLKARVTELEETRSIGYFAQRLKQYDDLNKELTAQNQRLREALKNLIEEHECMKSQWGEEYLWKKWESPEVLQAAKEALAATEPGEKES